MTTPRRRKFTRAQARMINVLYHWYTDATANDVWYRAHDHGERVTLASLYYRGLAERRVWAKAGTSSPAHEYKLRAQAYDVLHARFPGMEGWAR